MIKEKLKIFLITYNRKQKLKETLDNLLNKQSPIKNFDITVLDNASTDGSSELLEQYTKKFPNLTHVRHPVNIGGNANICRAFELGANSNKEYVWILCDDDKYDFSNWKEVEKEFSENNDIICVSDYIFPTNNDKNDPAYQIFQLTFVPAGIYKTNLITDTVLMNMYDSIYTMFQQSCLTIDVVNRNGKIYVCSKPLVHNGLHFSDKTSDVSYARGSQLENCIDRRRDQVWIIGYVAILTLLKDKNLIEKCIEASIPYQDIYDNWENFYKSFSSMFLSKEKFHYFYEVWNRLPIKHKKEFTRRYGKWIQSILLERELIASNISFTKKICSILHDKSFKKYILQSIFSIKNSHDKKYKIVKLFGIRIKLKKRIYTINDIDIFLITHNRSKLIIKSLDSLVHQSIPISKIIVLDNDSTDNTESIIKSYKKTHNINLIYIKTHGHLGNYHKARQIASQKYCMLFHDDDILHPMYIEYALKYLNRYSNLSLLTTKYTEFFTLNPIIKKDVSDKIYLFQNQCRFARYMYFKEHIAYAPAIYKTTYFKKEDLEFQKYNKFNDWPLMVKITKYGKSILFEDPGLFYIRRHTGQDTWTSTNVPSIQQIINWDLFFYKVFKKFNDKNSLKYFPLKARYFLKGKFDNFLDPEIRKNYPFEKVLQQAKELYPISLDEQDIYNVKDYLNFLNTLSNYSFKNNKLKYILQSIFSIKNSHDKQYKILKILGIRIKFKRKHYRKG